jgi:hypothetical protein
MHVAVFSVLVLWAFPWDLQWSAAQGVTCQFQTPVQCRRNQWGFELQVLRDADLSTWPPLYRVFQRVTTLRRDQTLLVLRVRWINRSPEALVIEPSAVWFWLQSERPLSPLQWEDLMGLLDQPNLPQTPEGRWFQSHTAVEAVYVPPNHFTERFLLFRIPTEGWSRCQVHFDPVWVGTQPVGARLFCRKKRP